MYQSTPTDPASTTRITRAQVAARDTRGPPTRSIPVHLKHVMRAVVANVVEDPQYTAAHSIQHAASPAALAARTMAHTAPSRSRGYSAPALTRHPPYEYASTLTMCTPSDVPLTDEDAHMFAVRSEADPRHERLFLAAGMVLYLSDTLVMAGSPSKVLITKIGPKTMGVHSIHLHLLEVADNRYITPEKITKIEVKFLPWIHVMKTTTLDLSYSSTSLVTVLPGNLKTAEHIEHKRLFPHSIFVDGKLPMDQFQAVPTYCVKEGAYRTASAEPMESRTLRFQYDNVEQPAECHPALASVVHEEEPAEADENASMTLDMLPPLPTIDDAVAVASTQVTIPGNVYHPTAGDQFELASIAYGEESAQTGPLKSDTAISLGFGPEDPEEDTHYYTRIPNPPTTDDVEAQATAAPSNPVIMPEHMSMFDQLTQPQPSWPREHPLASTPRAVEFFAPSNGPVLARAVERMAAGWSMHSVLSHNMDCWYYAIAFIYGLTVAEVKQDIIQIARVLYTTDTLVFFTVNQASGRNSNYGTLSAFMELQPSDRDQLQKLRLEKYTKHVEGTAFGGTLEGYILGECASAGVLLPPTRVTTYQSIKVYSTDDASPPMGFFPMVSANKCGGDRRSAFMVLHETGDVATGERKKQNHYAVVFHTDTEGSRYTFSTVTPEDVLSAMNKPQPPAVSHQTPIETDDDEVQVVSAKRAKLTGTATSKPPAVPTHNPMEIDEIIESVKPPNTADAAASVPTIVTLPLNKEEEEEKEEKGGEKDDSKKQQQQQQPARLIPSESEPEPEYRCTHNLVLVSTSMHAHTGLACTRCNTRMFAPSDPEAATTAKLMQARLKAASHLTSVRRTKELDLITHAVNWVQSSAMSPYLQPLVVFVPHKHAARHAEFDTQTNSILQIHLIEDPTGNPQRRVLKVKRTSSSPSCSSGR